MTEPNGQTNPEDSRLERIEKAIDSIQAFNAQFGLRVIELENRMKPPDLSETIRKSAQAYRDIDLERLRRAQYELRDGMQALDDAIAKIRRAASDAQLGLRIIEQEERMLDHFMGDPYDGQKF